MNITAATTDLTGANCNKYTFHYAYDTYMLAAGTGKWATENLGKQWYIIYPNYAFGQDMEKSFRGAVEKNGGEALPPPSPPLPDTTRDFPPPPPKDPPPKAPAPRPPPARRAPADAAY